MRPSLTIHEVGLRDGLQNEGTPVPTEGKAKLLEALLDAGIVRVEATSFVSPTAVPQMADAPEILAIANAHAERVDRARVRVSALVLNAKGYARAKAAGAREVAMVVVVTETLALRNSRMGVAASLDVCREVLRAAASDGVPCRVYLAPAWVCPFEGAVPEAHLLACAEVALEAGAREVALADTIGQAHPRQVRHLFEAMAKRFGSATFAAHLHDTQALGLANAAAALDAGVTVVDASVAGLGGCPFAPGAAGNLATEDLALLADKMGFDTGLDLAKVWRAVGMADALVGRRVGGRTRAWWERHETQERGGNDATV